jgi:hypothetical protein
LLVGLDWIDPNALALGELEQQLAPQIRLCGDERGAREIDDADHHLRDLVRARFAFGNPENLKVGGDRDED